MVDSCRAESERCILAFDCSLLKRLCYISLGPFSNLCASAFALWLI